MPRVLVTGSRDWTNRLIIGRKLYEARACLGYDGPLVLVSGACPTGADRLAEEIWEGRGYPVERHPAEWNLHGKRAGFIRNSEMVNLGADLCLAFIKNGSNGASMTAGLAEKAGIETWRVIE